MKTLGTWVSIVALGLIAMSLWSIANDLHELRWTLLASQREASR